MMLALMGCMVLFALVVFVVLVMMFAAFVVFVACGRWPNSVDSSALVARKHIAMLSAQDVNMRDICDINMCFVKHFTLFTPFALFAFFVPFVLGRIFGYLVIMFAPFCFFGLAGFCASFKLSNYQNLDSGCFAWFCIVWNLKRQIYAKSLENIARQGAILSRHSCDAARFGSAISALC